MIYVCVKLRAIRLHLVNVGTLHPIGSMSVIIAIAMGHFAFL
jgi:hypothetical protein